MNAFLQPVLSALKTAMTRFTNKIAEADGFNDFLLARGWFATVQPSEMNIVQAALTIVADIEEVIERVKALENLEDDEEQLLEAIIPLVKTLFDTIKDLDTMASSSITLFPLNQGDFWNELASNLADDLLVSYIRSEQKHLHAFLHFVGVIEYEKIEPAAVGRIPYIRKTIHWEKIGDFLGSPLDTIKTRYNWGSSTPDYDRLFTTVQNILVEYGIITRRSLINASHYNAFYPAGFNPGTTAIESLEFPLIESMKPSENAYTKMSFSLMPAATNTTQLGGMLLVPDITGFSDFKLRLSKELMLKGTGYFSSDNLLGFTIKPDGADLELNTGNIDAGAKLALIYAPATPAVLMGGKEGTRLLFGGAETSLEVKGPLSDPELIFSIGLGDTVTHSNFLFVYEPGEGDGFIKKILGSKPFASAFGIGLKWSSKHGISFTGSGGFEIEIPLHDEEKAGGSDGPLQIDTLRLGVSIGGGKFSINAGVDIRFKLGFISGSVTDIGASLGLVKKSSGDSSGILNNLDLKFGFKPPKGIGLSVKASAFEGGGYLYLDPDKGRYYGAVEIKIAKKLGVTAVGIITTKNPDGTDGFSMLMLICVTFSPSLPIGFGFSLSGVGGIAGVNRTLNAEALRLGVKKGSIDHILFPQNVVENIQAIVTDLESIFPTQQKRYTFGVMFLLGWGVPTPLIKIKLGVIIEVPSPVKLAIIGTIGLKLPSEEKSILQLNVAFAGIIDFDKKYLTFDATIYDSKILTFSLSGDMAVRMFWGDHREMLMSVGGFHPAYNPPAYLMLPAKMDRLTLSIFNENNLKLILSTYFAVTSNTVQFGARLDFLLKVSRFRIIGLFGFDVLFQFNPFKFQTGVYAMLAVMNGNNELLSINLDFFLEGPGPWHARGHAEFRVLRIKFKASFDKTWGPQPATTLPDVAVLPLIEADLDKKENWQAALPSNKQTQVQLKAIPETDLVLHPLGVLTITQKIAPLGVKLERFGNQRPTDGGTYDIGSVKINNVSQATAPAMENFAPAQFREMKDDQKLKAASFEYLKAGVSVKGTQDWYMDSYATREVTYDTIVIDTEQRNPLGKTGFARSLVNGFISGGFTAMNDVSRSMKTELHKPVVTAAVNQEKFQIVSKDSLNELSTINGSIADTTSGSLADALSLQEVLLQQNPALAGRIQVVPLYA